MIYLCTNCGRRSDAPAGRCAGCQSTRLVREQAGVNKRSLPRYANEITIERKEKVSTGVPLLDSALGGFVKGYSVLISGGPGVGKSTLITQVISSYARPGLYTSSEEEDQDIVDRMRRIDAKLDGVVVYSESTGEQILTEANGKPYQLLVIDSIQLTAYKGFPIQSIQGGIELCKAAHTWAHERGAVVILVCQETKSGDMAGAQSLAHCVDCVMGIEYGTEYDPSIRFLQVFKNRKGHAPIEVWARMTEGDGLIPVSYEDRTRLQKRKSG